MYRFPSQHLLWPSELRTNSLSRWSGVDFSSDEISQTDNGQRWSNPSWLEDDGLSDSSPVHENGVDPHSIKGSTADGCT